MNLSLLQVVLSGVGAFLIVFLGKKIPFAPTLGESVLEAEGLIVPKVKPSELLHDGNHCPYCKRQKVLSHMFEVSLGHSSGSTLWREFTCPKCGVVAQQPEGGRHEHNRI